MYTKTKQYRVLIAALLLWVLTACSPIASLIDTATAQTNTEQPVAEMLAEVETEENLTTIANAPTNTLNLEASLIDAYAQASPSVVYILVGSSSGSGFVYSDDGYIITNNHVVSAGNSYEIVFANGERQSAQLVGSDADSDLAVLKVDTLPEGTTAIPLAKADSIQVGQFVIAIGSPFGEQGSMSMGIVSGLDRSLPSQRQSMGESSYYTLPQVIQTDAPINPGNSGGPLLNLAGEVIGVNAAIATTSGTNSGVGFSIPVAAVRKIVPTLIAEGDYSYPYMGAMFDGEITLDEKTQYGLAQTQGTYVLGVTAGSPADEAGLIAANPRTGQGGDLIVALDDQAVNDFTDLNSYLIFDTNVGQTIEVTILRNGKHITLPLTLGARPQ